MVAFQRDYSHAQKQAEENDNVRRILKPGGRSLANEIDRGRPVTTDTEDLPTVTLKTKSVSSMSLDLQHAGASNLR
ncbi:hypothetical protein HFO61_20225 [Rhizobium leguminosarum]|uniref:hypothetical protein n=1 Tax=Rhizobium leguminosarum TaxID=384 RepID=UPI001C97F6B0|nr:hypothetical protein [Rhizobium leguminosarum]MBY5549105.1 hypothetical protein [Rhizobium leguminosarum]